MSEPSRGLGRLLVLGGATASGKTALALTLAERLGGELVGADSVQVYQRLNVGSAKPTREELRGVPHHLLDVVSLTEPFDAAAYVLHADRVITEVRARGRVPIVVGGTGFYLRALVRGLAEGLPADPELRARLQRRIDEGGREALAALHRELSLVDPDYASTIHPTDPVRIVRALEVHALSGIPLSEHHRRHARLPPRYEARFVALDVPKEVLHARIAARARVMLASGWREEVSAILSEGYSPDLKPLRSVGYAELCAHLLGALPEGELEAAIVRATKAFAKRQRTWFRGEKDATWRPPEALTTEAWVEETRAFLGGTPPAEASRSWPRA